MSDQETTAAERQEARGELARVDAKTGSLAAITTLMITISSTALLTQDVPVGTWVAGWATVLLLFLSLILMVFSLRPTLPPRDSVRWVVETPLMILSAMTRRKFALVRYACDLVLLSCLCAMVALVLALMP